VHLPTTDGRELLLSRYTEPELTLLLEEIQTGAARPTAPKITATGPPGPL
jgi:hypothetical protein